MACLSCLHPFGDDVADARLEFSRVHVVSVCVKVLFPDEDIQGKWDGVVNVGIVAFINGFICLEIDECSENLVDHLFNCL